MTTPRTLKIDLVSDVVCPWCAIGLNGLEIALDRLKGVVQAEIHLQPFQLNPATPPEGEDIVEHLSRKYGMSAEQVAANQEAIRQRGRSVGFEFRMDRRGRTWNTFDAHRLLHWAEVQGRGLALKHALLSAYFTDGENPGDHAVLVRRATDVGLDPVAAQAVLSSGQYAAEVQEKLSLYAGLGIRSVPSFIVDDQHLIEGGQPPELFEQALRQLAAN
ncbi:DsbA family oxidoreductase [Ideonella sp. A 288]|uniref:DsbA family oxidoreductase n=1 Tax=Ideonella sp. A 288 TaxID=1962181 RepID=UPI000B4BDE4A|nr:DsbA family oxidoreductase [Ideonella sp. A 288]